MRDDDTQRQQFSILNHIGSTLPRRIMLVLMLAAGAFLLVPRLEGVGDALRLTRQASVPPLLVALACEGLSILSHTYVVHRLLLAFGRFTSFWKVLQVALASGFATMFIPSVGVSGLALRSRYLGEYGYTTAATLLTFSLEGLLQAVSHCVIVILALLWHVWAGQAAPWWALALLLSMVLLGSVSLALLLSAPHKPDWRYALLARANRLRTRWGRLPIPTSELEKRLSTSRQAVLSLGTQAGVRLLFGNIGRTLGGALCLQFTLMAFGQAVPFHSTVISYSLSDILGGASSLPGGLFVTETSLSASLANSGVPLTAAVAATLTFRLMALWLPRALGLGTWYNLQRHSSRPLW
jgi:uncharacterized protein (TIRG00374 family)